MEPNFGQVFLALPAGFKPGDSLYFEVHVQTGRGLRQDFGRRDSGAVAVYISLRVLVQLPEQASVHRLGEPLCRRTQVVENKKANRRLSDTGSPGKLGGDGGRLQFSNNISRKA